MTGRQVRSYATLKAFAAALIAGRKTCQGFKIVYYPKHETTEEDFDKFCMVVRGMGSEITNLKKLGHVLLDVKE